MDTGKTSSQCGHAYLGAWLASSKDNRPEAAAYAADLPGTKVCLKASYAHILRAKAELDASGIPSFLVVDSGCLDFFEGKPTVTALGFGPVTKDQLPRFVSKMQLL